MTITTHMCAFLLHFDALAAKLFEKVAVEIEEVLICLRFCCLASHPPKCNQYYTARLRAVGIDIRAYTQRNTHTYYMFIYFYICAQICALMYLYYFQAISCSCNFSRLSQQQQRQTFETFFDLATKAETFVIYNK